ncbi:MAG: adenine phosphoribosyltransferase [Candidatus Endonucleobacter bathymodioli]|uniref:Adenine phosphoribosyltransferase n=1 Tax=Candidatus Endonucleibacter bathymodioli TaxID=539814 RepID=A0AA90P018_9GAMM|nr:adenine phosphoribosyltransferase [Candidatus Endonucleobacter bathymodioli]
MSPDDIDLQSYIRSIENWPKQDVIFRDITTLFENPKAFHEMIDRLIHRYHGQDITHVAAIDARGFLLGSPLAYTLKKPLVLVRKKGKLPASTISQDYEFEYGTATIEMHADALKENDKVLLVDDLIATGGTILAAAKLIQACGALTVEAAAIIDLPELGGSRCLITADIPVYTLCSFDGK